MSTGHKYVINICYKTYAKQKSKELIQLISKIKHFLGHNRKQAI